MLKKSGKWKSMVLIPALITAVIVAGCSKSGGDSQPSKSQGKPSGNVFLSIGGNPVGLAWYQMAVGLSEVLNKNMPNTKATAEATAGAVENVRRMNSGEMEIGFTIPSVASDSHKGQGDFQGKKSNIMALMSNQMAYLQVLALKDSNIKTLADLKGKRVGMAPPGSASHLDAKMILEANSISDKDMKPFYVSATEAVEMMKDGQIDAVIQTGAIKLAPFMDLANTRPIVAVPVDDSTVKKISEKYPYFVKTSLPANNYKGMEKSVDTVGYRHIIVVRKDLSEEVVYNATKTIYENLEYLRSVHNGFKEVSDKTLLDSLPIPLHPGAAKYYKEKGIPGLDEFIARTK